MTADDANTIDATASGAISVLRTLVLSDLVDSTALVERLGDQRAAELFRKHDRVTRSLLQSHGGREIDKTDGFLLMFDRPIKAVAFALDYQRELKALGAAERVELAARVGIHVGDVVLWDNSSEDIRRGAKGTEVEGLVKPIAARLMGLALPGQILLSGTGYDIAHRAQGELGERLVAVRWRAHGRYKFKGVPDPVPVFEVGEEGIAPLKAPQWSSKAHRETPLWRRPLMLVFEGVALFVLVAVPIWYAVRPAPAIAFADRDWVVVGDLRNLTSAKIFDDSLQTAFRIGLEQSRYVNVVPELQVRDALKRMERDPDSTVDRNTGSEIAVREGARALVLPSVAEIGGRVRVTAEVIDPKSQTSVYSDSIDGVGEESVLPSMDALLRKMRGRLGESMSAIGNASEPLARITTGNLDALRALGSAESELGKGKVNDAMLLMKEALRLDPGFALAWVRLSTVQNGYISDSKAAFQSLQNAQQHQDRLSAREKLFLDATVAQYANAGEWVDKWTVAAQLYPDAFAAQQNLGLGYLWYQHRIAESLPHFLAVANSRHPLRGYSWMSLVIAETERGNDAQAMEYLDKVRALGTRGPNFEDLAPDLAAGRHAVVLKRLSETPETVPPTVLAEKQVRLAAVAIEQGRDIPAREALVQATQISATTSSVSQQARTLLALAAFDLATHHGDGLHALQVIITREAARAVDSTHTLDGSPALHLALAAMLAVRAGDPKLARTALEATRSLSLDHGYYDREALWRTADCEQVHARDPLAAVGCLRQRIDGREYFQAHVALERALRLAGRIDEAEGEVRWMRDHRGRAVAELEKEAALIPNLLALRSLARTQSP